MISPATCSFFECYVFFFFNDTATTEIYTLSLHDALPILNVALGRAHQCLIALIIRPLCQSRDRKSTRLNSSHMSISYAVFCLKQKNKHFHGRSVRWPCCRRAAPRLCGCAE